MKARLQARGHEFVTQTDTEIVAHLVASHYNGHLEQAVRKALAEVEGVYALVLLSKDEPQKLVAARRGPPLVIGVGEGERFVASDIPALLPYTRDFIFLDDGDVATITPDSAAITDVHGKTVERPVQRIAWDPVQAEKGGYRHFMLKEIHEQPRAVRDTLLGRIGLEEGSVHLEELGEAEAGLKRAERVVLLACGTSWHAALVGKFLLEQVAGIPAEVDYGSEFRYRTPLVGKDDGRGRDQPERRDRRHAGRVPRGQGQGGPAPRHLQREGLDADPGGRGLAPHPRRSGDRRRLHQGVHRPDGRPFVARPLPGPAAWRAQPRGGARPPRAADAHPPPHGAGAPGREGGGGLTRSLAQARDFLYLGRGINYPIALEGALKLKEISYVHAEGYPAGEMKHGPIALIDESLPVVALCPAGRVYEKMLSNLQEAKARGGRVLAVACRRGQDPARAPRREPTPCSRSRPCPETWSPFLMVLPLQLLAYYAAVRAGRDVDQPGTWPSRSR